MECIVCALLGTLNTLFLKNKRDRPHWGAVMKFEVIKIGYPQSRSSNWPVPTADCLPETQFSTMLKKRNKVRYIASSNERIQAHISALTFYNYKLFNINLKIIIITNRLPILHVKNIDKR